MKPFALRELVAATGGTYWGDPAALDGRNLRS